MCTLVVLTGLWCATVAADRGDDNGIASNDLTEQVERLQAELMKCGPIALCFCLTQLGYSVDVQTIEAEVEITPAGVALSDLVLDQLRHFFRHRQNEAFKCPVSVSKVARCYLAPECAYGTKMQDGTLALVEA